MIILPFLGVVFYHIGNEHDHRYEEEDFKCDNINSIRENKYLDFHHYIYCSIMIVINILTMIFIKKNLP